MKDWMNAKQAYEVSTGIKNLKKENEIDEVYDYITQAIYSGEYFTLVTIKNSEIINKIREYGYFVEKQYSDWDGNAVYKISWDR